MSNKQNCDTPEEHHLHYCELTANPRNPEVDKMLENPRYACTNCGGKVHNAENVCAPKEL